jgi:hypothetical protein
MRKLLATFVLAAMMLISLPLAAEAHAGCRRHRRASSRSYASQRYAQQRYYSQRRYAQQRYYSQGYASQRYYSPRYSQRRYASQRYYSQGYYAQPQRPSFYRRHRNVINMGIATGAGALLGGIIGGRRGAGIGALLGVGGGALYTYKIRPKKRRY